MLSTIVSAKFICQITPISKTIERRVIKGGSWHKGCPVDLKDLRYLKLNYYNFNGNEKIGELIVNKIVAQKFCKIFKQLYKIKYPIKEMRLVSDFKADDDASMRADNTSAFNCRLMTGSKTKWSNHSYGLAIDLNPFENPYISKSGKISPKEASKFVKRVHFNKAVLLKDDLAVKVFKKEGFIWGGDWHSIKDYQHFEYRK